MFTPEQVSALSAKLDPSHVKTRQQSGRTLSYIEGWQAIAEANRIFGYDAWSRETVEIKCVSEREREIGQRKEPGWGVTYIAKVRVRVGEIVREGCGTGHGIDRDLGQAHESALKESETDAMKRALMTFGNPFGLALYDKEQAQVGCDRAPTNNSALDSKALANDFIREITLIATDPRKSKLDLQAWLKTKDMEPLTEEDYQRVSEHYKLSKANMKDRAA